MPRELTYIYVAWWGTYSSGGSEGTDPKIEQVPDGTDYEIYRYLSDEVLPSCCDEDYQSEHWRGVEHRRLNPEEVKAYIDKVLMGDIIRFFDRVQGADRATLTTMLNGMVQIDGFPRVTMTLVRDLFTAALKGLEDGNDNPPSNS